MDLIECSVISKNALWVEAGYITNIILFRIIAPFKIVQGNSCLGINSCEQQTWTGFQTEQIQS